MAGLCLHSLLVSFKVHFHIFQLCSEGSHVNAGRGAGASLKANNHSQYHEE